MNEFLQQSTSILERRFLKNAFLPVLLLPLAVLAPVALQNAELEALGEKWRAESGTVQLLQAGLAIAIIWFVAAIVASQWRNIIRLFEGYPLMQVPWLGRACANWYWDRREALSAARDVWALYYYFPEDQSSCLPTKLGNILRAAERYPLHRYGAETIIVWPRLYHLLDRQVVEDVEDARASLEFLLVVSLWFLFAGLGGAIALNAHGDPILIALVWALVGVACSYLAYVSAIRAAVEYGEQLRSTIELYRLTLLEQLRIPVPTTLGEEQKEWKRLQNFVSMNRGLPDREYAAPSAPSAGE